LNANISAAPVVTAGDVKFGTICRFRSSPARASSRAAPIALESARLNGIAASLEDRLIYKHRRRQPHADRHAARMAPQALRLAEFACRTMSCSLSDLHAAAHSLEGPAGRRCARLSSWHGPAMIEIGKSLPNLTSPAVTTGAAEMLAFKALILFRARPCGHRPGINPI